MSSYSWHRYVLAAALTLASVVSVPAQNSSAEPVIVVLGDSLSAGFELPEAQAFPAQLEAALKAKGHAVKVINAGVSGDTSRAGLARLDWAVPDDAAAVIVELGANDALEGLPPEATKAALDQILSRLEAKKISVLLAGMEAPPNMGKDYVEAFRAAYADLAKTHDVVFYPFFLDGAALNQTLMMPDGMHPNEKGVARIVEGILPKVEELLAKIPAKQ